MVMYDALIEYSEELFLENGPGYWVNYEAPDTFAISGYITGPLTFTAVKAGWVLVGSRSTPLQVSSLQLSDDAKRMGSVFRYDITTRSYWATQRSIRVKQSG